MKTIRVPKGTSFRSALSSELWACQEAFEWVGKKSLKTAYKTCKRGDWILWLAGRVGVNPKHIVLAACACAKLSLGRIRKEETRPQNAITLAERWATMKGGVSKVVLLDAASAARRIAHESSIHQEFCAGLAAAAAARSFQKHESQYAYDAAWYAVQAGALTEDCADAVRQHISLKMLESAMKRTLKKGQR